MNNEQLSKPKAGFFKRQFQLEQTINQKVFDAVFGIFLPLLCFYLDPIVFKSEDHIPPPLFEDFKPFAYLFSFFSIACFALWFSYGEELGGLTAALLGLFGVGAVFCFVTGVILLPFSLLGLIFLIGILGFTPFLTGFVYLRNSIRALKVAKETLSLRLWLNTLLIGASLSLIVPIILNVKINKAVSEISHGDKQTIMSAAERLKYVGFLVNTDKIAREYGSERSFERKQAIANAYQKITGQDVEERRSKISD